MAHTIRSDLIVPEVLEEAVRGEFAGMKALYGTGAAVVSSRGWPDARGGDEITIPYFGTIGEFEDLAASEDDGAGEIPALTPAKLSMTSETATVAHSGKAFEITEWARIAASYADPYAEAARQIRVGLERLADSKLLVQANATTLSSNVYNASTPVTASWTEILKARFLFNDEQDDLALIVMHSEVALQLLQEVDGNSRPIWENVLQTGVIPANILGIAVKISDRATKTEEAGGVGTPASYNTLLLKRNSLAFWFNGGQPEIQTDKDILADSTVAALHVYYAAHRYTRLAGSTLTGVAKLVHN